MGCFFVFVQKKKGNGDVCRGVFVAGLENVCREMSKNGVFLAPSHDAVDDELFMECALQVSVVVVFLNGICMRQTSNVK